MALYVKRDKPEDLPPILEVGVGSSTGNGGGKEEVTASSHMLFVRKPSNPSTIAVDVKTLSGRVTLWTDEFVQFCKAVIEMVEGK